MDKLKLIHFQNKSEDCSAFTNFSAYDQKLPENRLAQSSSE